MQPAEALELANIKSLVADPLTGSSWSFSLILTGANVFLEAPFRHDAPGSMMQPYDHPRTQDLALVQYYVAKSASDYEAVSFQIDTKPERSSVNEDSRHKRSHERNIAPQPPGHHPDSGSFLESHLLARLSLLQLVPLTTTASHGYLIAEVSLNHKHTMMSHPGDVQIAYAPLASHDSCLSWRSSMDIFYNVLASHIFKLRGRPNRHPPKTFFATYMSATPFVPRF